MSSNDAARPRGTARIAERIRSRRAKEGPLSIYSRLHEAAIENCAAHIAGANAYRDLDDDALTRSVLSFVQRHSDAALTTNEATVNLRARRQIDAQPIPVRDINRQTLAKMNPMERLDIANGAGLSARFKLLGPDDAQ